MSEKSKGKPDQGTVVRFLGPNGREVASTAVVFYCAQGVTVHRTDTGGTTTIFDAPSPEAGFRRLVVENSTIKNV